MVNHTRTLLLLFSLLISSLTLATNALDLKVNIEALDIKSKSNNHLNLTNISFSESQKKLLARMFVRQIRATGKITASLEVAAYISNLGIKLSAGKTDIIFLALQDNAVNAFAGLGGVIAVNSGLILTTETEGELASVLAHEIAHVYNHHIERIIEDSNNNSSVAIQTFLVAMALVAASGGSSTATQAALISAFALPAQQLIKHTRLHETDADATGVEFLKQSGYNPNEMITMLKKLSNLNKFDNMPPEFLLTHPLTDSRISMLQNIIDTVPYAGYHKNNQDFYVIQAILRLANNQFFYGKNIKKDATKIAYAMYLQKSGNSKIAKQLVKTTLKTATTNSIYFKLLVGQYFKGANNIKQSLVWYQKAYQQNPDNLASIVRFTNALLQNNHSEKAKRILDKTIIKFPQSPDLYQTLALYYAKNKKMSRSHYWRAKSGFLNGLTKQAIQQLLLARKNDSEDFYLNAKIDAKIEEYQRILDLE